METLLSLAEMEVEQQVCRLVDVADIFESYRLAARLGRDVRAARASRAHAYQALLTALQPLDPGRAAVPGRSDGTGLHRPRGHLRPRGRGAAVPADLIPRIIDAVEWDHISRGVRQRVLAHEAFLADVYGSGQVFADGVVPRRVVLHAQQFRREAAGLIPPNGVRVHVAGIDLVRDEQGRFRVLEDNLRTPRASAMWWRTGWR